MGELSETPVPAELQALWDRYKTKQTAEGKTARAGGGGFSGKGYKFDESEALAVNEKKKFQKAALGLQDSDEEDIENDLDEQIETLMAAKRIVREVQASSLLSGSSAASVAAQHAHNKTTADKLELAKRLASKINLTKLPGGVTPVVPETSYGAISARNVAEQLAAKLNTRLNYAPQESEETVEGMADEGGEGIAGASDVIQKFEEELKSTTFLSLSVGKLHQGRLSHKLASFRRLVYLYVEHTVQLAKRLPMMNENFIWLLKVQVKWPFRKPGRRSFEF